MTKRIISLLLAVIMVISTPTFVFATEEQQANTSVSTGNMTVEGTNGFGNLVSQAINDQEAESESSANAGYVVTGMEITGNTATVTYGSIEDATLVVAIYTEDGSELLCSGFTEVSAEEELAIVTIDGEIPEYFLASAYLLDNYDFSPLSNSFESPLYTKDMQDLLASSVDDYDEDRLLNLDDNSDTNFAVFSEETIIVDEQEGVNTVTSVDDNSSTYVIENADESITGLQQGDILAYPYGEDEILIVKVDSISINGTTVTITGQDVELEEVFDYVKVEGSSEDAEPVVDESVEIEGVTYDGLVPFEDSASFAFRAIEVDKDFSESCGFSIDLDLVDKNHAKVKIAGSLKLKDDCKVSIYATLRQQYIYFRDDVSVNLALSVSGSVTSGPIPLFPITFSPVPGLSVGFEPELSFTFEGKVDVSAKLSFTSGFDFRNPKGKDSTYESLCTVPKFEWEGAELEVCFGIEIDLKPTVTFMKKIAKASLKVPVGAEVSIEAAPEELGGESIHDCNNCFDGTITGSVAGIIEINLFNSKRLGVKIELMKLEFELGKFYYSHDYKDFGFGLCPHRSFLLIVVVLDQIDSPIENVEIKLLNSKSTLLLGTTNKNGVVSKYVAPGEYTINTTSSLEGQTEIKITDEARKAVVYLYKEVSCSGNNTGLGKLDPTTVTTTSIIGRGKFGAEGDNLSWALYSNGTLTISGQGAMDSFNRYSPTPWQLDRDLVKKVIIHPGVTSIGDSAFDSCENLISITIPDSVTSIGLSSFNWCTSLTNITLPNSVTSIGDYAFNRCESLATITIPDSVTSIGGGAFSECSSLSNIILPDSVISIYGFAFQCCSSLTSITIPNSVTYIGLNAFASCTNLTSVTIPNSLTTIESGVFLDCKNLTSITIPDSVVHIYESAFRGCSNLTSITIPNGVDVVRASTFASCTNLTSIAIPDSVTGIRGGAFEFCDSLTDVYYSGSESQWNAIEIQERNTCLLGATIHYNSSEPSAVLLADDEELSVTGEFESALNVEEAMRTVAPTDDVIEEETKDPAEILPNASPEDEGIDFAAIVGGEYDSTEFETHTLRQATFTDLVPGQQYVILALKDIAAQEPLAKANLVYIDQAAALEDGSLVFEFVDRENLDVCYIMACGASNKNLKDAVITFPEMFPSEELQVVTPTVVYDGITLVENTDYVLLGDVVYSQAGEYTCFIRGIFGYTGLVECDYKIDRYPKGDVNLDGEVNADDLTALARHVAKIEALTNDSALLCADVDGNGLLSADDLTKLARYVAKIIPTL